MAQSSSLGDHCRYHSILRLARLNPLNCCICLSWETCNQVPSIQPDLGVAGNCVWNHSRCSDAPGVLLPLAPNSGHHCSLPTAFILCAVALPSKHTLRDQVGEAILTSTENLPCSASNQWQGLLTLPCALPWMGKVVYPVIRLGKRAAISQKQATSSQLSKSIK